MMITGSIVMFAGTSAPNGWLICDGSAISRETYSSLFNEIGTTFGEGDGETTFNIPDISGKVLIGYSETHPFLTTGGEEYHTLTDSEIPSHVHNVGQHGHQNEITFKTPELSHSITQAAFTYSQPNQTQSGIYGGSNGGYGSKTSTNATLSTKVSVSNHAASACTLTGSITDKPAFNTENAGLSDSHNNMQPYITLNYIIYAGV